MASGATFTAGTATVVLNGTGSQTVATGGNPFNNLTISNTGGGVSLDSAIQVNGSLNVTAGSLDTTAGSNFPIGIAANWTNAGIFLARSGTVTFNGTSAVNPGASSFNNISVADGASAALSANVSVLGTLRIGVSLATASFDLAGKNLTGPAAFANVGTLRLQGGRRYPARWALPRQAPFSTMETAAQPPMRLSLPGALIQTSSSRQQGPTPGLLPAASR